jgi:thioredoxin 1
MRNLKILKFTAAWCGPCKSCAPAVAALAKDFPDVVFAEIDVDQNEDRVSSFNISAMPTFIIFCDDLEYHRVTGGGNVPQLRKILVQLEAEDRVLESLSAAITAAASADTPAVIAAAVVNEGDEALL